MSTESEMSGLLKIAGEKKGLLIAASIFSVLSSLLQIAPFVAVYKIVEELLRNAQSPADIDRELVVYWGVVAFLALVGALLALYVGLMCSPFAQPEQGLITALVGPSGSGKSTVTRLIARFWDVQQEAEGWRVN
ncbi:transporter [Brevibacillus agri]|nr:ATP-binding cassette domain-containing protein [Brevibacillus agri]MBG9564832.1 hypothetical protein [Brevibacillus agri]MED1646436.1 transporter [Brevibacillus agri]MED1652735.1 transporter [Brevibacillus agri]MED1690028.1 transporter [Brevibacillus agri]MED1691342.1 transporter [Brevibacillus agri]